MMSSQESRPVITYDCLTSNDIERIFQLGALERDVNHLSHCNLCTYEVKVYCNLVQRQFTVEALESNKFIDRLRRFKNSGETAPYTSALLFVHSKEIVISMIDTDIRIELQVVAPRDFCLRVDEHTLRLSGAVSANYAKIINADKGLLLFETAVPSKMIRNSLKDHYRVTDSVRLTGLYIDSWLLLSAQTNVTFCGG